jgi:hypothetical protein
MKFNKFFKNNFENLSTFLEKKDLEKLQSIYVTDIELFKQIQKRLSKENKVQKPMNYQLEIKQKLNPIEEGDEKLDSKRARKKLPEMSLVKKKNPDLTKKLIEEIENKKKKYQRKEIEIVPKTVKVFKRKEKYPNNYLIMHEVKLEVERLEKLYEFIKNYEKDKSILIMERMKKKIKDAEDFLKGVKELRDRKHREENHENREFFSESDEFMNKSEKFTLNIHSMLLYLLKHSDSELEFYNHIIKKSSKLFFQLHSKCMKEEVEGLILLEFLLEYLEMLHPFFRFNLSDLCKQPLKQYKNILPIRTFLQNLKDENRKFLKIKTYEAVIQKINYITDVVEFYYEIVNIFRLNEKRKAQVFEIYSNNPLKKNLFSYENKTLFEKLSYNFYNQIE